MRVVFFSEMNRGCFGVGEFSPVRLVRTATLLIASSAASSTGILDVYNWLLI
jgi:hypothetical protein